MASITFWNRIEPRPRTRWISDSLAACVRDPLWLLARQWQFREFQGEDAGSPALAQLVAKVGRFQSWRTEGTEALAIDGSMPLEAAVLAEGFGEEDLALAVELGLTFERALRAADGGHLVTAIRDAFPLPDSTGPVDARDIESVRFLGVVAGRCTHGVRLHLEAEQARPDLPAGLEMTPGDAQAVQTALDELAQWVAQTVGHLGHEDARAWDPGRFEYSLELRGTSPSGGELTLSAHADDGGSIDWFALDPVALGDETDGSVTTIRRSAIPGNVTFRGMPNKRWWRFEVGTANLPAARPERRELAKMVALDYVLLHSNDWYVLPLRLPIGSLTAIESLLVHDVFGQLMLVERADGLSRDGGWTMFSHVLPDGRIADLFAIPPTAASAIQTGDPIEEVAFVRDEMANMAWAIEEVTENAVGDPWPARDRWAALPAETLNGPAEGAGTPRYRIQTSIPPHWVPFLPVAANPPRPGIHLEEAVLLGSSGAEEPAQPTGRILRPSRLAGEPYRIPEEEVPELGERVVRATYRTRWTDGSTHVWVARGVSLGGAENRSGLAFDVLDSHPGTQ